MGSTGDEPSAVVLVRGGAVEVAVWRGPAPPPAALAVVDGLARLQLAARREGWSVRLVNPGRPLRQLLELVGLPGLLVEVDRQPEGGEQLGVQEVVQPDDPAP